MEIWRTVARERVMCMIIVGDAFARPMLDALEEAKSRGETLDLSCLKIVVSSGVIWSQGVKEKMLEWIDATLIDGVGATEGAMALQLSRRGQTGSPRSSSRWRRRGCSPRTAARSRRARTSRA